MRTPQTPRNEVNREAQPAESVGPSKTQKPWQDALEFVLLVAGFSLIYLSCDYIFDHVIHPAKSLISGLVFGIVFYILRRGGATRPISGRDMLIISISTAAILLLVYIFHEKV